MNIPAAANRIAWQPLTPRGVAGFARAPLARLLAVQALCAVLASAAVVWFLAVNWFPTLRAAIERLPPQGEIRSGRLAWSGSSPQILAAGRFLALIVDTDQEGTERSAADLEVIFGRNNVRVRSLLGYTEWAYTRDWIIGFNRTDLEPWWGAWAPPILEIGVLVCVVGLLASWAILATVHCWGVWLVGLFANRDLNLRASWKLAGAALMPGSALMIAGILLYGLGAIDLVRFLFVAGAHFAAGWIYSLVSPFFAPPLAASKASRGNPFHPPDRAA